MYSLSVPRRPWGVSRSWYGVRGLKVLLLVFNISKMGADEYGYREQNGQTPLNLLRLIIWDCFIAVGYYRMILLWAVSCYSHSYGVVGKVDKSWLNVNDIANNLPLTTSSDIPTVIHISVRSFSIKDDGKSKNYPCFIIIIKTRFADFLLLFFL